MASAARSASFSTLSPGVVISRLAHAAGLLHGVSDLVRQEQIAVRAPGRVLALVEVDVLAQRVGTRPHRRAGLARRRAGVDPDARKIGPERGLEPVPQAIGQRLPARPVSRLDVLLDAP